MVISTEEEYRKAYKELVDIFDAITGEPREVRFEELVAALVEYEAKHYPVPEFREETED